MTTPKEALEAARKCIWSGGDSLATVAIIDEALASLQGEDAVERVARIPHAEVDKIVSDLMSANYSDKPRLAVAVGRAIVKANERGLATGLVLDEAAIRADEREKCAKVADGWLAQFAHHEIKYVSARMYASDAIQDIATAIRKMPQEVKHEAE